MLLRWVPPSDEETIQRGEHTFVIDISRSIVELAAIDDGILGISEKGHCPQCV
jgi:hypothetical protein